ncbi:hypothetical protein MP638_004085 [Amoeboaphelidium occidentale]|nr:hypothetical protein MP638_004085 [Amoeboaphelidium occidentale]
MFSRARAAAKIYAARLEATLWRPLLTGSKKAVPPFFKNRAQPHPAPSAATQTVFRNPVWTFGPHLPTTFENIAVGGRITGLRAWQQLTNIPSLKFEPFDWKLDLFKANVRNSYASDSSGSEVSYAREDYDTDSSVVSIADNESPALTRSSSFTSLNAISAIIAEFDTHLFPYQELRNFKGTPVTALKKLEEVRFFQQRHIDKLAVFLCALGDAYDASFIGTKLCIKFNAFEGAKTVMDARQYIDEMISSLCGHDVASYLINSYFVRFEHEYAQEEDYDEISDVLVQSEFQ